MATKRYRAEQILGLLRQAEVELAQGQKAIEICRKLDISEQIYCRGRKQYGGLKLDQARRQRELEKANHRLKKVVANQALELAILKEAASGNSCARFDAGGQWITWCGAWGYRSGGPAGCWGSRARASGVGRPPRWTSRGW
jgi:hypothetical protein